MDREVLLENLSRASALISDCLKSLGADRAASGSSTTRNTKPSVPPRGGLPDHILELREKGVFKAPRTAREVHEALGSMYPCDFDRVRVALIRLTGRKQLRKTSKLIDGKKTAAYVW